MTAEELAEELRPVPAEPNPTLDAIARRLVTQSREPVGAAVKVWRGQDASASTKAALILAQTDDLAIGPLLEASPSPDPKKRAWMLGVVTENTIALRDAVRGHLLKMLSDKAPVPVPRYPDSSEEQPQPFRVCDEAYLQLRRLDNGESLDQHYLNARYFLGSSDQEKDAEINRARTTHVWKKYLEP